MDYHIKIRGQRPAQSEVAGYLVKTLLWLRDRKNQKKCVYLSGVGSAIPVVLLVTEIIRKKLSNVSSICEFEQVNKNDSKFSALIKVKLTLEPTEEDKSKAGFQEGINENEEEIMDIYEYVMLYVKELYQIKSERQKRRIQKIKEKGDGDGVKKQRDGLETSNQMIKRGQARKDQPIKRERQMREKPSFEFSREQSQQQQGQQRRRGGNRK